MKPLILMLLISISIAAQSLPDLARQERERKAANKGVRVFTTEDVRSSTPPSAAPATAPTPAAAPNPAQATAPAVPAAKSGADASKKYTEDLAKLKAKVVRLQDQDTALQLQIIELKNSFLAPVIDQATQAQAQLKLDETQTQLADTQKELADTKKAAQDLEAQGPPKP